MQSGRTIRVAVSSVAGWWTTAPCPNGCDLISVAPLYCCRGSGGDFSHTGRPDYSTADPRMAQAICTGTPVALDFSRTDSHRWCVFRPEAFRIRASGISPASHATGRGRGDSGRRSALRVTTRIFRGIFGVGVTPNIATRLPGGEAYGGNTQTTELTLHATSLRTSALAAATSRNRPMPGE